MSQLLPCPFCGSADIDLHFAMQGDHSFTPGCMSCGGSGPDSKGQSDAELAESWNRRQSLESVRSEALSREALLDQLVKALNTFDSDVDMGDLDSISEWWEKSGSQALNAWRAYPDGEDVHSTELRK